MAKKTKNKITKTRTKKDGTVVQGSQGETGTQPVNMEGWSQAEQGPGSPDPNAGWDTEQLGQEPYHPELPPPPGVVEAIKNATDPIKFNPNNKGSIKTLQERLVKEGYLDKSDVDGAYGPTTHDAYVEFEKNNSGWFGDNLESSIALPSNLNVLKNDLTGTKAPISRDSLTDDELEALQKIVRTNVNKGKFNIEYDDYKTSKHKNDDVGAGSASPSKLLDPAYNLKTILGQANINIAGNDTLVVDTYDFNDARDGKGGVKEYIEQVTANPSLYNLTRKLGTNWGSPDGEGASVIINTNQDTPEYTDGGPFKTTLPAGPREDAMTDAEMRKLMQAILQLEE